jgi:murein L,D-transpeptidase YafK
MGVVLLVAGCGFSSVRTPTTPQLIAAPESRIDGFSLALVVHKSRQLLSVYRKGTVTEQYAAVFGQQNHGDKLYEGDLRTPEGLYRIVGRRRHARWRYFLELDYPNERDRQRYRSNLHDDRIPVIRGKTLGIGGGIGIHGSDRPTEQHSGTNWTRGCIALTNDDVDEIRKLVKLGTPVLVLP